MKVFNSIHSLRSFLAHEKSKGTTIGFVPTMGALHQGHLELVKIAARQNDKVVVSIFVNPTQFNKQEDFDKYPRNVEADLSKLSAEACDAVFLPDPNEMYPADSVLSFNVGYLDTMMEGAFRPGHFAGVSMVVAKFFNIVQPDKAYFGQKDLQQLVLIKKLVEELNFNLKIIEVPIVREDSGLAMSSRNQRLDEGQKQTAACIYKGLTLLKGLLLEGQPVKTATAEVTSFYNQVAGFELEYLSVVNRDTLLPVDYVDATSQVALCVAGEVGGVRLLDNVCLP